MVLNRRRRAMPICINRRNLLMPAGVAAGRRRRKEG